MSDGRRWIKEEDLLFADYCKLAEFKLNSTGISAIKQKIKDEAAKMILGERANFALYKEEYEQMCDDLAAFGEDCSEKVVIGLLRRSNPDRFIEGESDEEAGMPLSTRISYPVKMESEDERAARIALEDCKQKVKAQLVIYYDRFTFFMHHHARALAVSEAISDAGSLREIKSILENQESLFSAVVDADIKAVSADLLTEKFSRELKNKPTDKNVSAYYQAIVSALAYVSSVERVAEDRTILSL